MQKNLVIVESPAKAKTIEKFLGKEYKVMSSFGHIRDLKKKDFSIDTETFIPTYEIPTDKKKVVEDLRKAAAQAETVWLASDEDREGEAISWHLFEVLELKAENTKRIVFHEITKDAITAAIQAPRNIDINLVNAQQARRVLDRIVGFKLSPVLWKKVKPSLSAGRVQSVAVRLIVEREREIQIFQPEAAYRVVATFMVPDADGNMTEMKAELGTRFKTKEEAEAFLQSCKTATFTIEEVQTKPGAKSPAAPFTTSTLQQEAARKLGFSVSQTMTIAQRLYESGQITYMRTDSTNLSGLCLGASKKLIIESMGEQYHQMRNFKTKAKGAQEAHEAIRPTYMDRQSIDAPSAERRLYELIWKRTIASQMAEAQFEKTTATISVSNSPYTFTATGEVLTFDGFLRVYRASTDEENEGQKSLLPPLQCNQQLQYSEIQATERYTQRPNRYNEGSLVKKLEELGIGRPSTYAPTISTIQNRDYVVKEDSASQERTINVIKLKNGKMTDKMMHETYGSEKASLKPTDIGTVVNDFLIQYFPQVLDYNFTASIEKEFDDVAEGEKPWDGVIATFYKDFSPLIDKTMNEKQERKVGERILGTDPQSGRQVSVKIGRFGPVVQIGLASDTDKPRFAQLQKGQSIDSITLDEALNLFALPRTLGEWEGIPVAVNVGRFGPYIQVGKEFVSLPATLDPLSVSLDEAIELVQQKRQFEQKRQIKTFDENPDVEILNGRYGPYIAMSGKNYKIPTGVDPASLDLAACMEIIEKAAEKPATPRRRKSSK
ncbi:MAG: type I DNA topoisomerase [Bacteroidaceae bacterium]|nr:type I DNA topoisomerase [Bacteroidaceae bacterium]